MNPFPCVRLRGLPYSAQREDIADFLGITPIDIVILEKGGRPTGQALVLASNPEDMDAALEQDKKNIGARYIEVFQAIRSVRCPREQMTVASCYGPDTVAGPCSFPPLHQQQSAGRSPRSAATQMSCTHLGLGQQLWPQSHHRHCSIEAAHHKARM